MEGQMDVGTRDTMTIALKAEGALVGREFLFQLFLYQRLNRIGTACTGLREPFENHRA
jgi:hypothetical protein